MLSVWNEVKEIVGLLHIYNRTEPKALFKDLYSIYIIKQKHTYYIQHGNYFLITWK